MRTIPMTVVSLLIVASLCVGCASDNRVDSTPPAPLELSGMSLMPQPGWESIEPASTMRAAEFVLDSDDSGAGDASLVVYYFGSNSAGSIQANLDRWCGQFEQPDGRDSADVAIIDSQRINGLDVHTVDLSGTYVAETRPGSGERVNEPDTALLAAIIETDAGPYYIKLVGPSATVERWRVSYVTMLEQLAPAPVLSTAADDDRDHP